MPRSIERIVCSSMGTFIHNQIRYNALFAFSIVFREEDLLVVSVPILGNYQLCNDYLNKDLHKISTSL